MVRSVQVTDQALPSSYLRISEIDDYAEDLDNPSMFHEVIPLMNAYVRGCRALAIRRVTARHCAEASNERASIRDHNGRFRSQPASELEAQFWGDQSNLRAGFTGNDICCEEVSLPYRLHCPTEYKHPRTLTYRGQRSCGMYGRVG